jgi:cytochrome oxidase Cu insertion factor (SCO1/SenC/PrrC family)
MNTHPKHPLPLGLPGLLLALSLGFLTPSARAGESRVAAVGRDVAALPDPRLLNQEGKEVRFHSEVLQDKVFAINFVFTSCSTICPMLGATFGKVQELAGSHLGREVVLVTVTIDPGTDTPRRLKDWVATFHPRPGWSLLTGSKPEIDRLLKDLNVYSAEKTSHAPVFLVGGGRSGRFSRVNGFPAPEKLWEMMASLLEPPAATAPAASPSPPRSAAARYFTDTPLVTQEGKTVRFYSDLLQDKTVVINNFFTGCGSVCPVLLATCARLQDHLGDRLGQDVNILSISVDPDTDTPAVLKTFATQFKARPGWYFLTGSRENVQLVLRKLGQYSETKEAHSNLLLVGNDKTGLWKKLLGVADAAEIARLVDTVVSDQGGSAQ